ncbi:MAG: hypothetical protein K8I82_25875, partial [Anaerolineae bacterium]|nr:hypothetical protein [Anaerolineae bacterium]
QFNLSDSPKIWMPGCGASIMPHIFAMLGGEVWASDVSEAAIQIQTELNALSLIEYLSPELAARALSPEQRQKKLHLLTHDFREPFITAEFDWILNIKSFQRLPPDSMKAAAKVHYDALANQHAAIFSMMNVQGELQNTIETVLAEAGFLVPFYEPTLWYRKQLVETGIPHVFILGQPIVQRGDERYRTESGEKQIEQDQQVLRSFGEAYKQRLEKERETIQRLLDTANHVKIAQVVYNTG